MKNEKNLVLALKYRPKNFKELIGQGIMVETISNSIKLNKLPNAYLLTGIRGIGKTTTARIIAKALNCNKHFEHNSELKTEEFCNCDDISNSKHLDVLEMDAASKTGIDDVRELIESSKYNPTSAKYKIIILDEVHMLSKQAFNGLLKTLEEPPPHLKFIFATTEVKKIPVTIISRCQRFDLHRVTVKDLLENLKRILKIEKGKISEKALILIAKAAEGSVRDSLSLLDRALISHSITNKEVDEIHVRKMLGIADRSKILFLLKVIFQGDQQKSITQLKELIDEGIEPGIFLNDLLEMIYFIQQKKSIGKLDFDLSTSESENEIIEIIANEINMNTLVLFWQFILKTIDELTVVSNPILSLEMLVIRLIHLKDMPSYEEVLNFQKANNLNDIGNIDKKIDFSNLNNKNSDEENEKIKPSKDQIKTTIQTKPVSTNIKPQDLKEEVKVDKVLSLEDLIYLCSKKKEIHLKYDLENNVNLIKFAEGKIDISFNEKLDKNFVRNLSEKLVAWTGNRWVITLAREAGQKTIAETQNIKKDNLINEEKKNDIYKKFKEAFDDGELLDVKKLD
jgi:DNA polymerase-3 subunit gamma/tau